MCSAFQPYFCYTFHFKIWAFGIPGLQHSGCSSFRPYFRSAFGIPAVWHSAPYPFGSWILDLGSSNRDPRNVKSLCNKLCCIILRKCYAPSAWMENSGFYHLISIHVDEQLARIYAILRPNFRLCCVFNRPASHLTTQNHDLFVCLHF